MQTTLSCERISGKLTGSICCNPKNLHCDFRDLTTFVDTKAYRHVLMMWILCGTVKLFHVFKYQNLMCFPLHISTLVSSFQMMISQPFCELTLSSSQKSLYLGDCFVCKIILVGSGFKYHIGSFALNEIEWKRKIQTQYMTFQAPKPHAKRPKLGTILQLFQLKSDNRLDYLLT